ncbi:MAG TPA: HEAT repeat domain-containing protein [Pyrinomonadaceae bacterium]|nr:HEAT repeat domain-containing protein [Pyrinomonadaceae bacterium]
MPDASARRAFPTRRTATPRLVAVLFAPLALVLFHAPDARAQILVPDDDEAPPPLKYVPRAERVLLDGTRHDKERTRLSLRLAEARLASATHSAVAGRFEEATAELGIYQAIVADAVARLRARGRRDDETLDLLKRVELTLRAHAPRVESVRRMTPSEHAAHVRDAYEFVRRARGEALEAFFGNTVAPAGDVSAPRRAETGARRPESLARLQAALDLLSDRARVGEAVPLLVELLKDEEAFVRSNAAGGLGVVGPAAHPAVPALIGLLKDKNALVRYSAAEAIRKIGAAAIPALSRASQTNR